MRRAAWGTSKKAAAIMGMLGGLDERIEGKGRLLQNHLHDMVRFWLVSFACYKMGAHVVPSQNISEAMEELCKIDMLGIKSAACVLQFLMGRDILAVDT